MTKIEANGMTLGRARTALLRLARNDLPVMTKVRVNSIRTAIDTVWRTWWEALDPVIRRYTEQPENEAAQIAPSHERYAEFVADPDAAELLEEELSVEIRPLPLSEIVSAEHRLDRRERVLELPTDDLGLLMELGIVTDDVTGAEEEEPPPKKKPAKKKRAKAKGA